MKKSLKDLRIEIDQLDEQLLALISARANCATEVGAIKKESGEDECQFYRPEREASILRRVAEQNPGPLVDEEMARLFRQIMSACLAVERQLNIAFLGPAATFTEEAALKHFGHSVRTTAINSISEVFREVESGAANYGVVPIENSTEGVITHTLDNFTRSSLKIVGEVELRIHHFLLSRETDINKVTQITSHQQSLAQCRKWLDANMGAVTREAVGSNAQAALIAQQQASVAAIASRSAAEKYDLNILASNIEDMPDNTTRFLIIGSNTVAASGVDKTSLLVSAPNKPGALYSLLKPFAEHNVSLTRIESRPSHSANWEYIFFLDLEGHVDDQPLKLALHELSEVSEMINILGSYPKAVL
jgi:chorismate mutase/prephenate dehydratase